MALQVQASILSRVYAYSQALRDPVTLLVVVRNAVGSPVQGLSGTFSRVVFRESGGTVPLNPDPQMMIDYPEVWPGGGPGEGVERLQPWTTEPAPGVYEMVLWPASSWYSNQVAQIAAASGAETGFALVPISMWDDVDDLREYVKSMATQIAGIASRLGV